MFSKILVPLDGSELAESALMPARAVAQNVHGELLLLSVTPPQRIAPEVGGVSVERSFEVVERSRREPGLEMAKCLEAQVTLLTVITTGDHH